MGTPMAVIKRIAIYTCITGGYDELLEPLVVEPGVDYICVSERSPHPGSVWRHLPLEFDVGDVAANSRFVKMHPHILFPNYDITIYVDGSIQVCGMVRSLALQIMEHSDIALYQHMYRNCIYSEAIECSAIGHDWHWRIFKQMNRYRSERFPANFGLYEAGVLIRNNKSPNISSLMEMWWDEYMSGVRRDQLSLTYLAWKSSVMVYNLGPSDPRMAQSIFSLRKIHSNHSLLTRIRGIINRRILSICHKCESINERWR